MPGQRFCALVQAGGPRSDPGCHSDRTGGVRVCAGRVVGSVLALGG
jgi:hypothetical protein